MPSIFSRKSKSSSRAQARPPSGVPENFGHTRGGLNHLRRADSDSASPPPPRQTPPPVQQDPDTPPMPQSSLPDVPRNTMSATGIDRYNPNGPARQQRPPNSQSAGNADGSHLQRQNSTNPLQSWSAPDARQQHRRPDTQANGTDSNGVDKHPRAANGAPPKPLGGSSADAAGRQPSSFWTMRPLHGPSLFPRRGFSAALNGHDLYWFGGKSDDRLHNDLSIMDSTTWTVAPTSVLGSVPAPREGHSASFIGRTMFVFGGELMDGRCDDNLYAYNMANYTWYKVPIQGNPLVGRKGHTTVSVGSKLYVFGGTVDGYYLQDLVSFDVRVAATQGARWSYIDYGTNVPPGRAGHSCSVYLNSIYLFGGMNRDECFNDLWAYNLEDQKWSKVTPHGATPPARYGHASAVVDDCIFIMGGRTLRGEPLNDFFAYKISLQRWYTFQVNSSAWPHQIDPVFSVVKSRLLLYSGNMPRDAVEPSIYSLDTSKIKIQPDNARPGINNSSSGSAAANSTQPQEQKEQQAAANGSSSGLTDEQQMAAAAADKSRRHRSLMPPAARQQSPSATQIPTASSPAVRATSMVGSATTELAIKDQREALPGGTGPSDALATPNAQDAKPQANGTQESTEQLSNMRSIAANGVPGKHTASAESLDGGSAPSAEDSDGPRAAGSSSNAWSTHNGGSVKGRAHQRRSIMLSQGLVSNGLGSTMGSTMGSPPSGPVTGTGQLPHVPGAPSVSGTVSPPIENSSLATLRDDKRLTIQLRNRNSVAIHGQVTVGGLSSRDPSSGATDSPIVPGADSPAQADAQVVPESATVPPFFHSPLNNVFVGSDGHGPSPLSSVPHSAPPDSISSDHKQFTRLSELPEPDLAALVQEGNALRNSGQLSISSEAKDALGRAWSALESKYSHQRQLDMDESGGRSVDASVSMQSLHGLENLLSQDATRVLNVLLTMRRELADAKQQLATVSQVAIERVTEAERGRKAALQEAIYLKAKASALTTANPALMSKLNSHRIHELERLYANTLNDNDALRNQLAGANLSLKQSHDALAEFKADAEITRKQLKELEQLYSQAQNDEAERELSDVPSRQQATADAAAIAELEQRLADAEVKLVEKESEIDALSASERTRSERVESALRTSKVATERAERIQGMFEESLLRIDGLTAQVSELTADLEKQKADTQRYEERASKFEQLWTDAKEEISAFGSLRGALENIESKEQQIAELERKLSDAQSRVRDLDRKDSVSGPQGVQPRSSFASDASSATAEHRIKEFQAAYLAAHRQWSEARDELMSLRNVLRDTDERRRDMENKLASRERELDDMQARLSAFTELLQEYADKQHLARGEARHSPSPDDGMVKGAVEKSVAGVPTNPALAMSDDEISVSSMLAAIQQLQRSSSITSRPSSDNTRAQQQQQQSEPALVL